MCGGITVIETPEYHGVDTAIDVVNDGDVPAAEEAFPILSREAKRFVAHLREGAVGDVEVWGSEVGEWTW